MRLILGYLIAGLLMMAAPCSRRFAEETSWRKAALYVIPAWPVFYLYSVKSPVTLKD